LPSLPELIVQRRRKQLQQYRLGRVERLQIAFARVGERERERAEFAVEGGHSFPALARFEPRALHVAKRGPLRLLAVVATEPNLPGLDLVFLIVVRRDESGALDWRTGLKLRDDVSVALCH